MKIAFAFPLLLLISYVTAPRAYSRESKGWIISIEGVNLRSAPSLSGKKVRAVPYGEEVAILDSEASEEIKIGNYQGRWFSVRYGKQEGYMFSAFVSREYKPATCPTPYLLLKESGACVNHVFHDPRFTYYGIYDKGNKYEVRKIKIDFNVSIVIGEYLNISTNQQDESLFIIGSKKALPEGIQKKAYRSNIEGEYLYQRGSAMTIAELGTGWEFVAEFDTTQNDYYPHVTMKIRGPGNTQKLRAFTSYKVDNPNPMNLRIEWAGDLDGDKRPDILISYGEKPGMTDLYLSSERRHGELIHLVASWMTTYCC